MFDRDSRSVVRSLIGLFAFRSNPVSKVYQHRSRNDGIFDGESEDTAVWELSRLSPPVKYFTDRSKAVLLLWIFYVFVLSCVCYVLCASVYMCFVVTCWERADLLALVCGVFCEFVTFPLVSWVRCGT